MEEALLKVCENKNLIVRKMKIRNGFRGILKGNKIAISDKLTDEQALETLCHEIAHFYLHYDKGNTTESPLHDAYEEQADRAAQLVLDILKAFN